MAERSPEEQAAIDHAKARLMRCYGCTEDAAYHAIRRAAADERVTLGTVARRISSRRWPARFLGRHAGLVLRNNEVAS